MGGLLGALGIPVTVLWLYYMAPSDWGPICAGMCPLGLCVTVVTLGGRDWDSGRPPSCPNGESADEGRVLLWPGRAGIPCAAVALQVNSLVAR